MAAMALAALVDAVEATFAAMALGLDGRARVVLRDGDRMAAEDDEGAEEEEGGGLHGMSLFVLTEGRCIRPVGTGYAPAPRKVCRPAPRFVALRRRIGGPIHFATNEGRKGARGDGAGGMESRIPDAGSPRSTP